MSTCETLIRALDCGAHDEVLKSLYAPEGDGAQLARARARAIQVVTGFLQHFSPPPGTNAALFSAPGRTELGGNHTDHQHGRVICGSVDSDMLACAAPNGLNLIRVCSQGYPSVAVELNHLTPLPEEQGTSAALVRGIAAELTRQGRPLSGVDVYMVSDVPSGSGLSSSAACEVLLGSILNHFCSGGLDAVQIAVVGQYAENVYFGKPCGLMDQMGCSVGGAVSIDFADPAAPLVKKLSYDFSRCGHALCIVDTGSCHADLTDDYAQIPLEMGAVAAHFGKTVLRDVPEEEFFSSLPSLRIRCGDRAVLRAIHFFEENRRVAAQVQALEEKDFLRFLSLVNQSGISSAVNLQNIWTASAPQSQAVSLALAHGRRLLENTGAIRVHGGGFAGTIQAFVPHDRLPAFKTGMESIFSPGACQVLRIRPRGSGLIIP